MGEECDCGNRLPFDPDQIEDALHVPLLDNLNFNINTDKGEQNVAQDFVRIDVGTVSEMTEFRRGVRCMNAERERDPFEDLRSFLTKLEREGPTRSLAGRDSSRARH